MVHAPPHRLGPGRPDDFQIRNPADFLNTLGETTQVFTALLAGVATVSLLVGVGRVVPDVQCVRRALHPPPIDDSMATTVRESRTPSWLAGATHALLRVMAGALFMQHGAQKLFGFPADPSRPWNGAPPTFSQFWIAGVLELVGGLLVALGLFTRPVAFVLAGEMAVAYFQAHAPRGFWPVLNGGEHTLLFCFIFLYFAATGAGPYGADAALHGRRR